MHKILVSAIVILSTWNALTRRADRTAVATTHPTPVADDTTPEKPPSKSLADHLKTIAMVLTASAIVFLLVLAVREIRADAVTIEVFSVPENLQKSGYDGRTLALRFIDAVSDISARSETQLERRSYAADWQRPDLDLTVPEIQTNLRGVVAAVRRMLRMPQTTFTCSIMQASDTEIRVSARLSGKPNFERTYPSADIDTALQDLASYYYRHTQPMIFAAYACSFEEDGHEYDCMSALSEILRRRPATETFYALNMMGLVQEKQDPAAAVGWFTDAIKFTCGPWDDCKVSDDVRASAFSNRGRTYMGMGRTSDAIRDLRAAARLAPRNVKIATNLGIALARSGYVKDALAVFDAARASDPSFAPLHLARANLLASTGQPAMALASYGEALQCDPSLNDAYMKRAELLKSLGRVDEANEDRRRARLRQVGLQMQSDDVRF